jgi:hypothetical protein
VTVYDFYYSNKQREIQSAFADGFFNAARTRLPARGKFKGKPYTECVEHGKKPFGNWDDYKFVGTGTISGNVTVSGVQQ